MKKNLIFIFLILFGLGLRLYSLDKYPLWLDEVTAASVERNIPCAFNLNKIFQRSPGLEKNDYLYSYNRFFIYYWEKISGDSEFCLRLSSVIFALLGLYMLYRLGSLLYGLGIARVSLFLLVISPFHIYYSQELRSYAAVSFLSLLSFYISLKIIKREKTVYWISYVLINFLSLAFNYTILTVILSQFVFLALNRRRQHNFLPKLIITHLIVFSLGIGLILFFHPALLSNLSRPVPIELTDLPVWGQQVNFSNILFTLKNFSLGYNIDFYSLLGSIFTFIFFSLFAIGCFKDKSKVAFTFKIVIVFLPVALIFLASKFVKSCYLYRYFLAVYPVYLLGVAAGLYNLKKSLRYFLLAIISVATVFSLKNHYQAILPGSHFQHTGVFSKDTDIAGTIRFISDRFLKNDKVFFTSWLTIPPFKFYIPKAINQDQLQDKQEFIREAEEGKLFWLDSKDKLVFISYKDARSDPDSADIFAYPSLPNRLWVVQDSFDPKPAVIAVLQNLYGRAQKHNFKNLEVYLFFRQRRG
ncbi:MAG: glycosyltransferase family 39 protein [Candidatus Omnitrophica bacterium]|nr:glycosyltransferase family 39 protein [Candidatus Omnitrophota bacterium]MDD5027393.1 glycosyltransferase family 39 protein [Candidatus Omnitrophota bacterium]MDD5662110.1 glycosyltransferase family 39 protein [Candidatus Omnitrophota bacterium]